MWYFTFHSVTSQDFLIPGYQTQLHIHIFIVMQVLRGFLLYRGIKYPDYFLPVLPKCQYCFTVYHFCVSSELCSTFSSSSMWLEVFCCEFSNSIGPAKSVCTSSRAAFAQLRFPASTHHHFFTDQEFPTKFEYQNEHWKLTEAPLCVAALTEKTSGGYDGIPSSLISVYMTLTDPHINSLQPDTAPSHSISQLQEVFLWLCHKIYWYKYIFTINHWNHVLI